MKSRKSQTRMQQMLKPAYIEHAPFYLSRSILNYWKPFFLYLSWITIDLYGIILGRYRTILGADTISEVFSERDRRIVATLGAKIRRNDAYAVRQELCGVSLGMLNLFDTIHTMLTLQRVGDPKAKKEYLC